MEDRPDDGSRDEPTEPSEGPSGDPTGGSGAPGREGDRGTENGEHGSGDVGGGEHENREQDREIPSRERDESGPDAGSPEPARVEADVETHVGSERVVPERDRGERRRSGPVAGDDQPDPEPGTRAARGTSRPDGWTGFAYDIATSVLAVLLVGGFLFAVSGVWPPLVAVESGSMVPNMQKGDLVFVMEEERFPGTGAVDDTGVVTARMGEESGYRRFNGYGDVIVFKPDGSDSRTPIIHRAMLYVEEGENWVARANPEYLESAALVCERVDQCPAPYDGFITKGDNNRSNRDYDQVSHLSDIVKPEWVVGTAELRLPGLGWIRLGSQ